MPKSLKTRLRNFRTARYVASTPIIPNDFYYGLLRYIYPDTTQPLTVHLPRYLSSPFQYIYPDTIQPLTVHLPRYYPAPYGTSTPILSSPLRYIYPDTIQPLTVHLPRYYPAPYGTSTPILSSPLRYIYTNTIQRPCKPYLLVPSFCYSPFFLFRQLSQS